jgi:hypothetical protein
MPPNDIEPTVTLLVLIALILFVAYRHHFAGGFRVRHLLIYTTILAILLGVLVTLSRS